MERGVSGRGRGRGDLDSGKLGEARLGEEPGPGRRHTP